MIFHPADSVSLSFYILFLISMFGAILYFFRQASVSKIHAIHFISYVLIFSLIVGSGAVQMFVIPMAPLLFLSVIGFAIYFAFGDVGNKILAHYTLAGIIGFQMFRLPLELILHQWANEGTIPETMTWTGQNWDIVTGILSLVAVPVLNRSKAVAWVVQIVGFLLLINVLRVVILSSPFPFSWKLDNPLQLILYMPYALIGPLFVGPALFAHLVAFRKLLKSR